MIHKAVKKEHLFII